MDFLRTELPVTLTLSRASLDALATAAAIGVDTDDALASDPTVAQALDALEQAAICWDP